MVRVPILAAVVAVLAATPGHAVSASRAPFGTSANGEAVEVITLRNDTGTTVRVSTRGGAILSIETPDRTGRIDNIVLGEPDFAAWDTAGTFNSVVGRYANRIASGGFTLDGKFYKIDGADPVTRVVLHSGPTGFASRLWQATTYERAGVAGTELTYVAADGEGGFPGQLTVHMTYALDNDGDLRIDYRATTTKPTVINLTNHSYFNIGGAASGPVYNQILQVHASRYTPTDATQIPTGDLAPVAGTPFDFRKPTRIGERVYSTHPQMMLGRGLDHNFVLDGEPGAAVPLAVRLYDPKSGRRLEVRTTEPGVQIYTANHFSGGTPGANGRTLRQGDAIAFETQHFPDSPNRPEFPTTVLRPGAVFHSVTDYVFSTDKKDR
ncbi:aldose epimerase family protein [Polymorphobacter megasporae]|uniref:aldose epimerase family protein n=1 Tax=Glacieibacterium megasporae TaxID=2835787 RepID=UPI001C1E4D39|nr:aldose epimerase family protein [Polymorphobacter megasporae]UAJ08697.1 galactose mutarotase [Polymorphobacter megasporae]